GPRESVAHHDRRAVSGLRHVHADAVRVDDTVQDLGSHQRLFGGCAFTAASLTSVPQPAPVGSTRWPFSIFGTVVTSSSYHGTTSGSIPLIRRLCLTAQMWAFFCVDSQP